ncbi:MAG TPA: hypothetical protein VJU15_06375 [Gemmatimonadales bacterium]|nr:hypothetical protein [Gemmatimonadales bacterium]
MKTRTQLTIASLLSLLLLSIHFVDDIHRGISPAGKDNIGAVVILVVWLVGILLLDDSRLGVVIMLLGGIFGAGMPVLHMRGVRYPTIAEGDGGFFFVWVLIAVGTTGTYTIILALRELWIRRSAAPR